MPTRRIIVTVVGAAAVAGLAGVGIGAALDDPDESVATIDLTDTGATPADGATGTSTQVPALDELTGVVMRDDDDDVDDLSVDGVELDFGPDSWVAEAPALADYDGDGTAEPLRVELEGLVGQQVDLSVRLDNEGDDADVYVINGLTYRDIGGPAPWQSGDAAGEDQIRAAAEAAVGPGATVVELEAEDGRTVAWEAEVVDADGREYDVALDAAGNVLDVRRD